MKKVVKLIHACMHAGLLVVLVAGGVHCYGASSASSAERKEQKFWIQKGLWNSASAGNVDGDLATFF